jgi:hypothetical protein
MTKKREGHNSLAILTWSFFIGAQPSFGCGAAKFSHNAETSKVIQQLDARDCSDSISPTSR